MATARWLKKESAGLGGFQEKQTSVAKTEGR